MNIALLTEKFIPDFGGLAISAGRLAGSLAASGNQVTVFHLTRIVQQGQVVQDQLEGVTIQRIGAFERTDDSLAAWFDQVCRVHAAQPFDLVHGFYLVQAGYIAALAGQYLNVPSVISARGNDLDRAIFDPGKAAHIFYALQHAPAVTTNTTDLAHKAVVLGARAAPVVIPNGVDAGLFCPGSPDPDLSHRLGLRSGQSRRPLVGFTGESRAKKGLDTLLSALDILASQGTPDNPEPQLLLVGGARKGADRDLLENFTAAHPNLVVVVPPQPLAAMPAFYRLMDVLALPSRHDGLPNSLLEGMACGLAIAASPVGGMADLLRDEENALLIPPDSPAELAYALGRLLANPGLRQNLGAQARRDAVTHYGLVQEQAAYLQLYRSLTR